MKQHLLLCLILLCLFFGACSGPAEKSSTSAPSTPAATAATDPLPNPLPNIDAMIQRLITQDGAKDSTVEMRMTGEDATGKREQIDVRLQRKYAPGRASTFLTVLSPKQESDKALLAIENAGQPTDAFSYLAGLKKLAKMSSNRQLGFRGAKVTVQELLGLELGQYTHDGGARVNEGGQQLIKVEFKQKPDLSLAFPRIVAYFLESNQQPVRFELYDERGELQKRLTIEEVKTIQNHMTPTRVAIEDLLQKLKLKLETRKIDYDRGLADSLFTESHLKNVVTGNAQNLDNQ